MIANSVAKRLLLAFLSGFILALCWPDIGNVIPILFLAFIPLLHVREVVLEQGKGRVTPYAFVTFLTWNFCTTYFLFCVSEPMSTRIFSYLAPGIANSLLMCIPFALSIFVRKRSGRRLGDFALVLAWLSFEYLHMDWDLTWSWLNLGNAFAGLVPWVQWYEYTGVLGGTLWVLALNLIFYRALEGYPKFRASNARAVITGVLVTAIPVGFSLIIHFNYEPVGEVREVVIVQPNVDPYNDKFTRGKSMVHLQNMLADADALVTSNTAFVLFPETAIQEPATLSGSASNPILNGLWENEIEESQSMGVLRDWVSKHPKTTVMIGMSSEKLIGPDEEKRACARPIRGTDRYYEAYNSALGVSQDRPAQIYHKSKLVPGVELLPFEGLLGTLEFLSVNLGGTTGSLGTQAERTPMSTADGLLAAPVICYESIFGEYVGEYLKNGAQFIAIITNDGWWSDSPGYKHHLAYARLRAIETRKDIARCANTGTSCFIDQRGNIHQATAWWQPAVISGNVRVHDELTFYTKHGDVLGRSALLVFCILLLQAFVKGRLRK